MFYEHNSTLVQLQLEVLLRIGEPYRRKVTGQESVNWSRNLVAKTNVVDKYVL